MPNEMNLNWIKTGEDMDKMVKWAENFGKELATDVPQRRDSKLTTSQLRRFYGDVKRQQARGFNRNEFVLLKPKLAYAVARHGGQQTRIKQFYDVMAKAIDAVENEAQFRRFIRLFEAIVAYHKAAE